MGIVYAHPDVLDNGISELSGHVNRVHIIKAYAIADTFATVTAAANSVANEAITPGDMALSNLNTHDRQWQCNAKNGVISTTGSVLADDLHIAYVDTTTNRVLYVTDEITDQAIEVGNPVNIPAGVYETLQPVKV